jgi:hypothetical protein
MRSADDPRFDAVNRQASVWMKRGLALLNENTPASLQEAIAYFDRAIELRRHLPPEVNPFFSYGLAAGWMNRGDALTRLGSVENLAEAVRAYDAALAALRDLPLAANPLFRRRAAIAWQNRGLTLAAQGALSQAEAEKSFAAAAAVLQHEKAAAIEDRDQLLATALMNHANVLTRRGTGEALAQARAAAKNALALTAQTEMQDAAAAEIGLKARHILCQAIAGRLAENDFSAEAKAEWVAEATDAVDDGLTLAQSWEQRGVTQFRSLARELFRFGARVYQIFQPQFLNEFLLEQLDPAQSSGAFAADAGMHAAALESLWRTFREIQRGGFKTLNTPQFAELLEKLRGLRLVEDRLAELRRQYLA